LSHRPAPAPPSAPPGTRPCVLAARRRQALRRRPDPRESSRRWLGCSVGARPPLCCRGAANSGHDTSARARAGKPARGHAAPPGRPAERRPGRSARARHLRTRASAPSCDRDVRTPIQFA